MIVHHFGPDPTTVGGMASVIRVPTEHRVGGDVVDFHPTWKPQAPLMTTRLFATSASSDLQAHKPTLRGGRPGRSSWSMTGAPTTGGDRAVHPRPSAAETLS